MPFTRRGFLEMNAALAVQGRRVGANDRVRFAVIGCGARSQELMAALMVHPDAEIASICDAYRGRVERTLDRVGSKAKVLRDYREAIGDSSIDALIVATPDHWHKQMVVDAVKAGKDVYCEKPLTFRSADGPEILAAVRQSGRVLQVGSQGMSSATQNRAKEMIRQGRLGKVTMIRAAYNRNTASGAWIYPIPPDASPQTVNWDLFLGPAPKLPFDLARFFRWRCYQDYSGGIATDLFVHLCTTIHYLMDARMPSRVVAMGNLYRWKESRDVPDTLNAILEYPEGFTVNLSSTFNNQSAAEQSFQFLGTEGTISIGWDGFSFRPENSREDNRWIVESWPKRLEAQYWADPKIRASELIATGQARMLPVAEEYRQEGQEATIVHFRHFLDSVKSRKPYWQDGEAGHHAAACAHMVNLAARTGKAVEWDFSRDDIKA
jgi:predicted dehydrogenase